ncbi:MAG: hypothetical protein CMI56_00955 [Parcubacteria group bacterium]|nr:hypothetical protein [Parcubacteria group bacterium]|tara:strand:- start:5609 stop:7258 length:1650 start_codon:yes stop_codon:yes gene_type:complete
MVRAKKGAQSARAAALKAKGVVVTKPKEEDEIVNDFFKIVSTPTLGGEGAKGVIALKGIKRGEKIWNEKPALRFAGMDPITDVKTELKTKKPYDEIAFDFAEKILTSVDTITSAEGLINTVCLTNEKFTFPENSDASIIYQSLFKITDFSIIENENEKFSAEQLDNILGQYVKLSVEERKKVLNLASGDDFEGEKDLNKLLKNLSNGAWQGELDGADGNLETRMNILTATEESAEKIDSTDLIASVGKNPNFVKNFLNKIVIQALFIPAMTKILDIYQSNSVPTNNEENSNEQNCSEKEIAHKSSLCPTVARFNHSCAHNAVYSWRRTEDKEFVIATKDIAKGEAINVTYLPEVHKMTVSERETAFKEQFGFSCKCELCEGVRNPKRNNSAPSNKTTHYCNPTTSDNNRRQIRDLDNIFSGGIISQIPMEQRINLCSDLFDIQENEYGSANPGFVAKIAFEAVKAIAAIETDNDDSTPGWREELDDRGRGDQKKMKLDWALRMRDNFEIFGGKEANRDYTIADGIVTLVEKDLPFTTAVIEAVVAEIGA